MKNPQTLLLLVLSFISLLFLQPTSAVRSPFPTTNHTDFIRTGCNTTLYPDLCYSTLSPFTRIVPSNLTGLARASISVCLTRSTHVATVIAGLSKQADPKVAGPLQNCSGSFKDAVNETSKSLDQMKKLGSGTGSIRFQLSNVQTWMSAAFTDVETCMDGLKEVEDGEIKTVVMKAEMVKKMMSIALSIVKGLASSVETPLP